MFSGIATHSKGCVCMCGHGTEPFAFQSVIVSMEAEIKVCSQFQLLLCVGRGVCQCQSTYHGLQVPCQHAQKRSCNSTLTN